MRKLLGIRPKDKRASVGGPINQPSGQSQSTETRPVELEGNSSSQASQNAAQAKIFREAAERKADEGLYEAAIVLYDQAIELSPQDSELFLGRAYAYSGCQKVDQAIRDVNLAIQKSPTNWQCWQAKADFLTASEQYGDAEESYLNAIGFSNGMNRVKLQNTLNDVRRRKALSPSPTTTPLSGPSSTQTHSYPQSSSNSQSSQQRQVPNEATVESPAESPPEYTPPPPPQPRINAQDIERKILDIERLMATKNKGQLVIKPYTSTLQIDAIQLTYAGLTTFELPVSPAPTYIHPTFKKIVVDTIMYPGNTYLDADCETAAFYDGELTGTTSLNGYSEEYRNDQLLKAPALQLALEASVGFPVVAVDKIVRRLGVLQLSPTYEDDAGLKEFLGLSSINLLSFGFGPTGTRMRRITSLCMMLTRAQFDEPVRFPDFSKTRTFSNNFLVSQAQDTRRRDFLFQILIGAEIFIRIRLEPLTTIWTSVVTDAISALIVTADLFLQNTRIVAGSSVPVTAGGLTTATLVTPTVYRFVAVWHQRNSEGLIRFAEAIQWPYMDEARRCIETAYLDLTAGKSTISWDMCDWLFGLVLPGKVFRHRIMSSLVDATPSIRSIGGAPFYENGLVVGNKSYWAKRTVLARVLGGMRGTKDICGWIGPLPAPVGTVKGWIRLNVRRVDIPVPVRETGNALESFGIDNSYTETSENIIDTLLNPNEFITPSPPAVPRPHRKFTFKSISLELVPPAAGTANLNPGLPTEEYRASLDFDLAGTNVRYTLYSNPVFVTAPPCVGSHVMFRRRTEMLLRDSVLVADLKSAYPSGDKLLIINALGEGDEVVARAWCAERGKHAIIRREVTGQSCCFTCASNLATTYSGLSINVLIWSK